MEKKAQNHPNVVDKPTEPTQNNMEAHRGLYSNNNVISQIHYNLQYM